MSINITQTGNRLFKETRKGDTTHEIEIFGDEKAFYVKQLALIDDGDSAAGKIVKDERDWVSCRTCNTVGWLPGDKDACPTCKGKGYNRS